MNNSIMSSSKMILFGLLSSFFISCNKELTEITDTDTPIKTKKYEVVEFPRLKASYAEPETGLRFENDQALLEFCSDIEELKKR